MVEKEIEISEEKFNRMIETAEKKGIKLSEEKKKQMRENYFNTNRKYEIKPIK